MTVHSEQQSLPFGSGDRERILGQRGCVIWLTGLSGSGKSTIAREVAGRLMASGRLAYILDGDTIRRGLNCDLGFAPADRDENIRRAGHLAAMFADAGMITVTAFISPYREGRWVARGRVPVGRFAEVYLDAPLDVCEARDPKGLYARARAGELPSFTGIGAPYEPPEHPELVLDTVSMSPGECAEAIIAYLRDRGLLSPPDGMVERP